jgi:hypothetical protein
MRRRLEWEETDSHIDGGDVIFSVVVRRYFRALVRTIFVVKCSDSVVAARGHCGRSTFVLGLLKGNLCIVLRCIHLGCKLLILGQRLWCLFRHIRKKLLGVVKSSTNFLPLVSLFFPVLPMFSLVSHPLLFCQAGALTSTCLKGTRLCSTELHHQACWPGPIIHLLSNMLLPSQARAGNALSRGDSGQAYAGSQLCSNYLENMV